MTVPGSDPTRPRAAATGPTTTPGTTAPGTAAAPGGTGPATTGRAAPRERHPGRTIGRTLALALLLFVTVVLALFVVYNTQTVEISLVFADVQAPLVLALVIAAALGGLLVGLAGLVLRARRRHG
ncbi:lipopolysaccharide assembly protein LapA domain-containing protein [Geodermatophilus sp. DSM 44513]|uniref:lipopolysaccharide assembly protein LapA domain-containing protein n=1 Tax=Geodermatophilus sp. DSM 44513 TaxID=1528104 RepID=UPI001273707A|nr:lipopolysaccharide assembly protein LapA domain-containing protein [Geodermatophilus sp. DSM 44513]WNV75399.1 lipopolysaccharide assembly protein LapA domain-containing protein [Geodermatophilus sp. DSM 44513]